MRQWIEEHEVLAVAIGVAVILALWYLRLVWSVALIGFILAASLLPIVDWLQARRLPRVLAAILTYFVLFGLIILVCVPLIASFSAQSQGLFTQLVTSIQTLFGPNSFFGNLGIDIQSVVSSIKDTIIPLTTTTIETGAGILTAIVISIYTLIDWRRQEDALREKDTSASRRSVRMLEGCERELGAWARGQLMLMASIGVLTFIVLMVLGVPYAGALAALAGFLELVPYAGPIIAAVPAIIIGLSMSVTEAIMIVVAYLVIHQIESQIVAPIVLKNAIRMHPAIVLIALLAGFQILGIVGAIIAVPLLTIARIVYYELVSTE